MAFSGRLALHLRSAVKLARSGIVKRSLSSQSAGAGSSFARSAAPFVLGASTVAAGLFAAKQFYDNTNRFPLIGTVHAATELKKKPNIHERTFIMVKPDGVQRGLVGDIIKRFEQKGFKIVAMKFMKASEDHLSKHYADLKERPFFPGLVKFMSTGPVCAMVFEGLNVVKTGRVMLGETDPAASKPGTIRGDYCVQIGRNIIHGSDSVESANKEIELWFNKKELVDWEPAEHKWVYE